MKKIAILIDPNREIGGGGYVEDKIVKGLVSVYGDTITSFISTLFPFHAKYRNAWYDGFYNLHQLLLTFLPSLS